MSRFEIFVVGLLLVFSVFKVNTSPLSMENDDLIEDELVTKAEKSLECPENFVLLGKDCYYISQSKKVDRFRAKLSCLAMGAELTKIENDEEMEALSDHLTSLNINSNSLWIAGSDLHSEGNFYWDKVDNKMTYTKWAPGQPSDEPNSQYCVVLEPFNTTYYMNDISCYGTFGYICEGKAVDPKEISTLPTKVVIKYKNTHMTNENCPKEFAKVGNKCYFVQSAEESNWYQALHTCRRMNSNLLTIESVEELQLLGEHLKDLDEDPSSWSWAFNEYWTSANDLGSEGLFHWQSNGEHVTYGKWFGDSPNNYNSNEHCVNLKFYDDGYYMNDNNCDQQKNFVCETPSIAAVPKPMLLNNSNELSITTCAEIELLKLNLESQTRVLDMLSAQQNCD